MADMFSFFLECAGSMFNFLASAELFSGLSILQFIVAFFVLFLIVDNFIIKAGKGSSSGGSRRKSSSASPKSKQGAGDSK